MIAISVRGLTKRYLIWERPHDRLLARLPGFGHRKPIETRALQDLSFDVPRGATLGIIGRNGSGKSTLLRLLAGLSRPSSGSVEVHGRVATLLRLGGGFHPEFSGRDNIELAGRLMGLSREAVRERCGRILEFSGIGRAIDRPVKTYSSGMFVRLAFAVAIHVDPDVLLLDEVLAVGDALFQKRCLARIREIQDRGTTIVLVSHDLNAITHHCDRALLLHHGQLIHDGSSKDTLGAYRALLSRDEEAGPAADAPPPVDDRTEPAPGVRRFGRGDAAIAGIAIGDASGNPADPFASGQDSLLEIRIAFAKDVPRPVVGYTLRDRHGYDLCATNTWWQKIAVPPGTAGATLVVRFRQRLTLGRGSYTLSPAVACVEGGGDEDERIVMLDWHEDSLAFEVVEDLEGYGPLNLESAITVVPER